MFKSHIGYNFEKTVKTTVGRQRKLDINIIKFLLCFNIIYQCNLINFVVKLQVLFTGWNLSKASFKKIIIIIVIGALFNRSLLYLILYNPQLKLTDMVRYKSLKMIRKQIWKVFFIHLGTHKRRLEKYSQCFPLSNWRVITEVGVSYVLYINTSKVFLVRLPDQKTLLNKVWNMFKVNF